LLRTLKVKNMRICVDLLRTLISRNILQFKMKINTIKIKNELKLMF
jgi:hypothetical protein